MCEWNPTKISSHMKMQERKMYNKENVNEKQSINYKNHMTAKLRHLFRFCMIPKAICKESMSTMNKEEKYNK